MIQGAERPRLRELSALGCCEPLQLGQLPITKFKNRDLSETRFLPEHQNHEIAYDDYLIIITSIEATRGSN